MGRAAGCPTNARWPCCGPVKEPAGRGGGPIGTPGRACGAAGRGTPGVALGRVAPGRIAPGSVAPKPVETGGTETEAVGAGAEPGARFTGIGWRGPESTCPGRGEPAAGIGRGGGTGRPGAAGRTGNAVRGAGARGAPTGGWIGMPRPSTGGRRGIARGLFSSSLFSISAGGTASCAGSAFGSPAEGAAATSRGGAWVARTRRCALGGAGARSASASCSWTAVPAPFRLEAEGRGACDSPL